jgi:hypothetical protein
MSQSVPANSKLMETQQYMPGVVATEPLRLSNTSRQAGMSDTAIARSSISLAAVSLAKRNG